MNVEPSADFYRAAVCVLSVNLIHGDAMKMRTWDDLPITFAEWGYLGKGKFQPVVPNGEQVQTIMKSTIESSLLSGVPPQEALDAAVPQIEAAIAEA